MKLTEVKDKRIVWAEPKYWAIFKGKNNQVGFRFLNINIRLWNTGEQGFKERRYGQKFYTQPKAFHEETARQPRNLRNLRQPSND